MTYAPVLLTAFLLPPESGEKVNLGVTVLLSICVFLLMVSEKIPETSDNIPVLSECSRFFMTQALNALFQSFKRGVFLITLQYRYKHQNMKHRNRMRCLLSRPRSVYSPFPSSGIENIWDLVCLTGKCMRFKLNPIYGKPDLFEVMSS